MGKARQRAHCPVSVVFTHCWDQSQNEQSQDTTQPTRQTMQIYAMVCVPGMLEVAHRLMEQDIARCGVMQP